MDNTTSQFNAAILKTASKLRATASLPSQKNATLTKFPTSSPSNPFPFSLSVSEVHFTAYAADKTFTQTITATNTHTHTCRLIITPPKVSFFSVMLPSSSQPLRTPATVTVAPGISTTFTIRLHFTPPPPQSPADPPAPLPTLSASLSLTASMSTSSPSLFLSLPLSASPPSSSITFLPSPPALLPLAPSHPSPFLLDFGVVAPGQSTSLPLLLINTGSLTGRWQVLPIALPVDTPPELASLASLLTLPPSALAPVDAAPLLAVTPSTGVLPPHSQPQTLTLTFTPPTDTPSSPLAALSYRCILLLLQTDDPVEVSSSPLASPSLLHYRHRTHAHATSLAPSPSPRTAPTRDADAPVWSYSLLSPSDVPVLVQARVAPLKVRVLGPVLSQHAPTEPAYGNAHGMTKCVTAKAPAQPPMPPLASLADVTSLALGSLPLGHTHTCTFVVHNDAPCAASYRLSLDHPHAAYTVRAVNRNKSVDNPDDDVDEDEDSGTTPRTDLHAPSLSLFTLSPRELHLQPHSTATVTLTCTPHAPVHAPARSTTATSAFAAAVPAGPLPLLSPLSSPVPSRSLHHHWAAQLTATLTIASVDFSHLPPSRLPVTASAFDPLLHISPSSFAFAPIAVGERCVLALTLRNPHHTAVTATVTAPAHYSLTHKRVRMDAKASAVVEVVYVPKALGVHTGDVCVCVEGARIITVPVSAEARVQARTLPENPEFVENPEQAADNDDDDDEYDAVFSTTASLRTHSATHTATASTFTATALPPPPRPIEALAAVRARTQAALDAQGIDYTLPEVAVPPTAPVNGNTAPGAAGPGVGASETGEGAKATTMVFVPGQGDRYALPPLKRTHTHSTTTPAQAAARAARGGRTESARSKKNPVRYGEGVDLGFSFGEGLSEPKIGVDRTPLPLPVLPSPHAQARTGTRTGTRRSDPTKPPTRFKTHPSTPAERADCEQPLSAAELSALARDPPDALVFPAQCVGAVGTATFALVNPTSRCIFVELQLDAPASLPTSSSLSSLTSGSSTTSLRPARSAHALSSLSTSPSLSALRTSPSSSNLAPQTPSTTTDLTRSYPRAQVIAPHATGTFTLALSAHHTHTFRRTVHYTINKRHTFALPLVADIVPMSLTLSLPPAARRDRTDAAFDTRGQSSSLHFAFTANNTAFSVQETLYLSNPHTLPVEYWFAAHSDIFTPSPTQGIVEPGGVLPLTVTYAPQHAHAALEHALVLNVKNGPPHTLLCRATLEESRVELKTYTKAQLKALSPAEASRVQAQCKAGVLEAGAVVAGVPASYTLQLVNTGSTKTVFALQSPLPPWASVEPAAGALPPHSSVAVVVRVTPPLAVSERPVLASQGSVLEYAMPLGLFDGEGDGEAAGERQGEEQKDREPEGEEAADRDSGSASGVSQGVDTSRPLHTHTPSPSNTLNNNNNNNANNNNTDASPLSLPLLFAIRGRAATAKPLRCDIRLSVVQPCPVVPSTIDFGTVGVCGAPVGQDLILSNPSTLPCLLFLSLANPEYANFSFSPASPVSVSAFLDATKQTETATAARRAGTRPARTERAPAPLPTSLCVPLSSSLPPNLAALVPEDAPVHALTSHSTSSSTFSLSAASLPSLSSLAPSRSSTLSRTRTARTALARNFFFLLPPSFSGSVGILSFTPTTLGLSLSLPLPLSLPSLPLPTPDCPQPPLSPFVPPTLLAHTSVAKLDISPPALTLGSLLLPTARHPPSHAPSLTLARVGRPLPSPSCAHTFTITITNTHTTPVHWAMPQPPGTATFPSPSSSPSASSTSSTHALDLALSLASTSLPSAAPSQQTQPYLSLTPCIGTLAPSASTTITIALFPTQVGPLSLSLPLCLADTHASEDTHPDAAALLSSPALPASLPASSLPPYAPFALSCTCTRPSLSFDPPSLHMPVVPLSHPSVATLTITSHGYTRVELAPLFPTDTAVPFRVAFPRGRTLTPEYPSVPVTFTASAPVPTATATRVEFADADGVPFSVSVHFQTDNYTPALASFLHKHASQLTISPPSPARPLTLALASTPAARAAAPLFGSLSCEALQLGLLSMFALYESSGLLPLSLFANAATTTNTDTTALSAPRPLSTAALARQKQMAFSLEQALAAAPVPLTSFLTTLATDGARLLKDLVRILARRSPFAQPKPKPGQQLPPPASPFVTVTTALAQTKTSAPGVKKNRTDVLLPSTRAAAMPSSLHVACTPLTPTAASLAAQVEELQTLLTFLQSLGGHVSHIRACDLLDRTAFTAFIRSPYATPYLAHEALFYTLDLSSVALLAQRDMRTASSLSTSQAKAAAAAAEHMRQARLTHMQTALALTAPSAPAYVALISAAEEAHSLRFHTSWLCVLQQVAKTLVLPRVNTNALRALPGLATSTALVNSGLLPNPKTPRIPPPLSNLYSEPELCLLTWLTYHARKGSPLLSNVTVTDWTMLRDGHILAALLQSHVGVLPSLRHLAAAKTGETLDYYLCVVNHTKVLAALHDIGLSYAINAHHLAHPVHATVMPFIFYLFCTLPALLPSSTITFTGRLGASVTQSVQLRNPSSLPITYTVAVTGTGFTCPHRLISLPAHTQTPVSLPVLLTARFAAPAEGKLTLVPTRRLAVSAAAAADITAVGQGVASPLVFALKAPTVLASPIHTYTLRTPLYEPAQVDIDHPNPFPSACIFTAKLVPTLQPQSVHPNAPVLPAHALPPAATLLTSTVRAREGGNITLSLPVLPWQCGQHRFELWLSDAAHGECVIAVEITAELPPPCLRTSWASALATTSVFDVDVPTRNAHLERAKTAYAHLHNSGSGRGAWEPPALLCAGPTSARLIAPAGCGTLQEVVPAAAVAALSEGRRVSVAGVALDKHMAVVPEMVSFGEGERGGKGKLDVVVTAQQLLPVPGPVSDSGHVNNSTTSSTTGGGAAAGRSARVQETQAAIEAVVRLLSSAPANRLRVATAGARAGVYTLELVLVSDRDVRVIAVTALVSSQPAVPSLLFTPPLHQSAEQLVPLFNATDVPHTWRVAVTGTGFSAPAQVIVPPATSASASTSAPARGHAVSRAVATCVSVPVLWQALSHTPERGRIDLINTNTNERVSVQLQGCPAPALCADVLQIRCRARESLSQSVAVRNPLTQPVALRAQCDLACVSGAAGIVVPAAGCGEYAVQVWVPFAGVYRGALVFARADADTQRGSGAANTSGSGSGVNSGNAEASTNTNPNSTTLPSPPREHAWYQVDIIALPPPPEREVQVRVPRGGHADAYLSLRNPLPTPATLSVAAHGPALSVDARVVVAAGATERLRVRVAPTQVMRHVKAAVSVISSSLGEYWFDFDISTMDDEEEECARYEVEAEGWDGGEDGEDEEDEEVGVWEGIEEEQVMATDGGNDDQEVDEAKEEEEKDARAIRAG